MPAAGSVGPVGAAQGDGPPGEEPTYAAGPQPEPGGPLPWPGPYPHPGPSSGPAPFPSPGAYPDPGPYPQPDQYRPPGGFAPAGPYPYPRPARTPGRGPYADGTYPPTPHPPGSPPFPGPPGLPSDIGTAAPPAHRWGLGAYLLVEAVFLLTAALVALLLVGDVPSAGELAVALAVPTVLAAGTALLITRVRGNGPRIDLVLALVVARRRAGPGLRLRRARPDDPGVDPVRHHRRAGRDLGGG